MLKVTGATCPDGKANIVISMPANIFVRCRPTFRKARENIAERSECHHNEGALLLPNSSDYLVESTLLQKKKKRHLVSVIKRDNSASVSAEFKE